MVFTRQNPPNGYYVYQYLRDDNTPYYIGKGKNKRAWLKRKQIPLPSNTNNIIIIKYNLTENEAFSLEKELINFYGRKDINTGILRNRTDGGDGMTNPSPETRSKMSKSAKNMSKETRVKMSMASKGRPKSPEHRNSLSQSHLGKNNHFYGKTHTPETRAKLSELRKGRKLSAETRAKMSGKRGPYKKKTTY
jgi:NUMOD3 motif